MIRPENTGVTDLIDDAPPVLHIVLFRDSEHPFANLENARTFKHELFHTRGYHLPVRLTSLEEEIKNQFQEYHERGLRDRTTQSAINQGGEEQLSWAMEALNLGVDQTHSDDWRKPRPELVDLIQQHKPQIAGWEPPKQQLARTLITNLTQQENNMTTQPAAVLTSSSTQTRSDKDQPNEYEQTQNEDTRKRPKQRFVCIKEPFVSNGPPTTGGCYPTHPLSRGVLRWLKAQAQISLDSLVCQWNGCYPEYQQLRQGTHPDPNPGLIITPDNPDRFKPEQIDVSHELPLIDMETDPILSKTLLSTEDYPLYQLETTVATIDRSAWYAIEKIRKQKVTSELYAQACIEELEKELSRHEFSRRTKEDPEFARQVQIQVEELHASITARNQPLQEQGVAE